MVLPAGVLSHLTFTNSLFYVTGLALTHLSPPEQPLFCETLPPRCCSAVSSICCTGVGAGSGRGMAPFSAAGVSFVQLLHRL